VSVTCLFSWVVYMAAGFLLGFSFNWTWFFWIMIAYYGDDIVCYGDGAIASCFFLVTVAYLGMGLATHLTLVVHLKRVG